MTIPSVPPSVPPLVEVVASHRGRIVDIAHLRATAPPALTPRACVLVGAVLLLLGLALTLRDSAPGSLGALLLALGLLPLALGLIRWRDRAPSRYTIGEAPGVDLTLALPGRAAGSLPLVIALEQAEPAANSNLIIGTAIIISLPPGVRGRLDGPGPLDLGEAAAQGRRSIALPADTTAHLELGDLQFKISRVAPAELARPGLEIDRLAWLSHIGAAAVLATVYMSLETYNNEDADLERARSEQLERVISYLTALPPPPSVSSPPATTPPPTRAPRRSPPAPKSPPAPTTDPDREPDSDLVAPTAPAVRRPRGAGRTDSEFDYDRVAGHLGDPGFKGAVEDFTVAMRHGQRAYAVTPDADVWWAQATGGPPRTSKHFGGLELAETERGGGVHDDTPRPKKPVSSVSLTTPAPGLPPPTPAEAAELRRIVTIEIDPPSVDADAGIDRLRLYQYARKKAPAWRTCYESALKKDPALAGVMQLQVHFDARGHVTLARAEWSTLTIGVIEPCIAAAARAWKLAPATPSPTRAVFHLQFEAHTR